MRYFCTYFDHRYLPKGLALYHSLLQHCPDFELWVLCLSPTCYDILTQLNLAQLRPIKLQDLEAADPGLRQAKTNRTLVEYYFTCTPCLPRYLFAQNPHIDLITYLDSDLFFFSSLDPLYRDLSHGSIAIIEHRFPPKLASLTFNGIYNVGWVSFRKDKPGLDCLHWWRERCLEWCHDYHQDGKFADQKYLDDWPSRFQNVIVLPQKGANLAPWNVDHYHIELKNNQFWVDEQHLIFYHFHGLKEVEPGRYDTHLGFYRVEKNHKTLSLLYNGYIQTLCQFKQKIAPLLPEHSMEESVRSKRIPAWVNLDNQSSESDYKTQTSKLIADAITAIEQAFSNPSTSNQTSVSNSSKPTEF